MSRKTPFRRVRQAKEQRRTSLAWTGRMDVSLVEGFHMQPRRSLSHAASGRVPVPSAVHWWLRLTSYGWDQPAKSLPERELIRRSQLASWILAGLLIVDIVLLPIGFSDPRSDPGTLIAVLVAAACAVLAAFLNRQGQVTMVAILLILVICGAILGSDIAEPGGIATDTLPDYDLLVMAVVVAASLLPPISAFAVAGLTSMLICLDFLLQPHALDLQQDLASYPDALSGAVTLLARPIALQILVATVAFLWVRGTERAINRADRAEELAALEHAFAEQKRQLEVGVQDILAVLVQVANGQYNVRVSPIQEPQLWQVGAALNNLLNRLQRASQTEYEFQRTREEIERLAASIAAAQAGRPPHWPPPSGTPVDLLVNQISAQRGGGGPTSGQSGPHQPIR
jgi:hypothetical protein